MKKLRNILISIVVFYVIGVVASFILNKDLEIVEHFSNTYALIGAGVGVFISLFIMLGKSSSKDPTGNFKGKDINDQEVDQHFNARFIDEKELETNPKFMPILYKDLPKLKKTGTFISSLYKNKQLYVNMYPEMHELVVGTTGSGKSTMILEPAIRVYSHSAEKPSMVITDPKGELHNNHGKHLLDEGYRIISIDLRNPFASTRWNPMEDSYNKYHRSLNLEKEVLVHKNQDPRTTKLKLIPGKTYSSEWYEFNKVAYPSLDDMRNDIKALSQTLQTSALEQLKELCLNICPVTNQHDPSWEQGCQEYLYGLAVAMLEDSLIPELGMTKDKFNLYNLVRIAQSQDPNPDNQMATLKDYVNGRDVTSPVKGLTNQIINNAPNTIKSYLGVLTPKISAFQDLGVCYATSESDLNFDSFVDQPTVLFIKVPDEKVNRHCIATMCISQIYNKLIEIATDSPGLTLPRPVYFLLDEFANLPKIEKFSQYITVARSRKIFFTMIIQSYSQLDNKYTKEVAETIRSNCNIQVYIGTEDQKTREDFSKLCGDITLQVENVSVNKSDKKDAGESKTISHQTVTRPLIEPYELSQLPYLTNIVKIYGQPAIKTEMSQWFKVPIFDKTKLEEGYVPSKYFDESKARYDIKERNKIVLKPSNPFDFDF